MSIRVKICCINSLQEARLAVQCGAAALGLVYAMPKLEHQLVNIRHAQHHVAQTADRIRALVGEGVA